MPKHKIDIDLTGKQFGEWTVLKRSDDKRYWTCRCSCGTVRDVYYSSLTTGKSKSCGHTPEIDYDAPDDMIGKRFGRLTVIKRVPYDSSNKYYLCKCDCGNTIIAKGVYLRTDVVKSCGCFKKNLSAQSMKKIMKQGHRIAKEHCYDGTKIDAFDQKISKNNTSGHKGVAFSK